MDVDVINGSRQSYWMHSKNQKDVNMSKWIEVVKLDAATKP